MIATDGQAITESPIWSFSTELLIGDVNGDCVVNILDLLFIRDRINKDVGSGDNGNADVNEDGKINLLDLLFVRDRINNACP